MWAAPGGRSCQIPSLWPLPSQCPHDPRSPRKGALLYPSRPWARSSTAEQLTLNQLVLGSNPSGLTKS